MTVLVWYLITTLVALAGFGVWELGKFVIS
jgi:hypothetical protein